VLSSGCLGASCHECLQKLSLPVKSSNLFFEITNCLFQIMVGLNEKLSTLLCQLSGSRFQACLHLESCELLKNGNAGIMAVMFGLEEKY